MMPRHWGNAKMKCTAPDIIDIIKRHNIFVVIETWLGSQHACPQPKVVWNSVMRERKTVKRKKVWWINRIFLPWIGKGDHTYIQEGDWSNTNNSRGIVISNCAGELYLKILKKRIDGYMVASSLWIQNKYDCKRDHRRSNIRVLSG